MTTIKLYSNSIIFIYYNFIDKKIIILNNNRNLYYINYDLIKWIKYQFLFT